MKLKILFSVILLSAISQLSSSSFDYIQARLNFGHNYRSQCASHLCEPGSDWFTNGWHECIEKYLAKQPAPKSNVTKNRVSIESKEDKRRRYFQLDCLVIGGGETQFWDVKYGDRERIGGFCWPKIPTTTPYGTPTYRFNTLACGFKL